MKTKTPKPFLTILIALILFAGSNVNAQSVTPSNLRFGIGVDGLLPVGNSTRTLNFGLGITPRLQYSLSNKVALTFTSGIYHFFPKTVTYPATGTYPGFTTKYKSDIIPVKVGAKFFVGSNFYLAGEVGAASSRYPRRVAGPLECGFIPAGWRWKHSASLISVPPDRPTKTALSASKSCACSSWPTAWVGTRRARWQPKSPLNRLKISSGAHTTRPIFPGHTASRLRCRSMPIV